MDDARNPYTPGAGMRPVELVGRERQLEAVRVLGERTAAGRGSRSVMLHGLRGVGKTVLLNQMRADLEDREWLTVSIEAQRGDKAAKRVRDQLERGLVAGGRKMATRSERFGAALSSALATISSFTVGVGVTVSVDLAKGRADSGNLEFDLAELVADISPALTEAKAGFAVFVDEIQDLDRDTLTALLATQHQAAQRGWPFYLFGAGLPSVPTVLAEARSYAERQFEYHPIGQLDHDQTAEALASPARRLDVTYEPAALARLIDASAGYPYFIQEFGAHAWRAAPGPNVISDDDALLARSQGSDALDDGFFRARWERATKAERRLLQAMAMDGDNPSALNELVERMNRSKASDLSVARRDLIAKGLVYAPARGELAFTVPLMSTYVLRQT